LRLSDMTSARIVALASMVLLTAGCFSSARDAPAPDGGPTAPLHTHRGGAPTAPVLGSSDYQLPLAARGFGHTHPPVISNGGDGTGRVTHIKWTGWGHATSYGYGVTQVPLGTAYPKVRAVVRVSDLGTCQRHPAYLRLSIRRAPRPGAPVSHRWRSWGETALICRDYRHRP
jgi:hypothetical protein